MDIQPTPQMIDRALADIARSNRINLIQFIALKFACYLIISKQADITALVALRHYSGDASRPQGAGYHFWKEAHTANTKALEWLMNDAAIENLVFAHYFN